MSAADLPLALSRHATSKIDGSDLLNIHSFGFRGEALPSLGAVGRLSISSRAEGQDGAEINVAGGDMGPVKPAALSKGTVIELRDLFYAIVHASEIPAHRSGRGAGDHRYYQTFGHGRTLNRVPFARCIKWRITIRVSR